MILPRSVSNWVWSHDVISLPDSRRNKYLERRASNPINAKVKRQFLGSLHSQALQSRLSLSFKKQLK